METDQALRILFVEDFPPDFELAEWVLRKEGINFIPQRVETKKDFQEALASFQPDLVVSDYLLPTFDGMQALSISLEIDPTLPVIILTGSMNEDTAVSCMKAGASDYVIKEHITRLPMAIKNALKQKAISRDKEEADRALRETNQLLAAMIQSSPLAINVLDREGKVTLWSPAAEALFGWKAEEVVGRELPYIPPYLREGVKQFLADRLHGDAFAMQETQRLRKDGTLVEISISTAPLCNPQGEVTGTMAIVADITERKQAEQALRQRLAEAEALHTVSAILRTANSSDEALPALLDQTLAALGCDSGCIWLHHPESGDLRLAAARGWFRQLKETSVRPGFGIAGAVFASGQIHYSPAFNTDPLTTPESDIQIPSGQGGVSIPIRSADETVGLLMISVTHPRQITVEEMNLLTSLAEMAGGALHRIRLHEETVHQLQKLEALRSIDLAITSSLDLRLILNILLENITAQLKVDAAGVLLAQTSLNTLSYAAGRGFRTRGFERVHLRLGEGLAGKVALGGKPVLVPALSAEPSFNRSGLLNGEAFIAYYGIPLVAKGVVKGVLEIFHRSPLKPEADWLSFLETMAGQAAIAIDNSQLFENQQMANRELSIAYNATIEGWARALDLRDREAAGHSQRVTELSLRLARALHVKEEDLVHIRRGCLLHDIGKLGVPDEILLKQGPLNEEEMAIMRKHPAYAYDLLMPITYLHPAIDIPYRHHEKWNGSGYPDGLKGDQIPLSAQIFAVVDTWDSLISERPFRAAWPREKALDYLLEQRGRHFNPAIVDEFVRLLRQIE